jgi:hypothetical protein
MKNRPTLKTSGKKKITITTTAAINNSEITAIALRGNPIMKKIIAAGQPPPRFQSSARLYNGRSVRRISASVIFLMIHLWREWFLFYFKVCVQIVKCYDC